MIQIVTNAGWRIKHETERTLLLVREDPAYRHYCEGRDGYVLARVEPGTPRSELHALAWKEAEKCDAKLALMIARDTIPADVLARQRFEKHGIETPDNPRTAGLFEILPISEYHRRQSQLRIKFGTPEDPQIRVYRP